MELFLNVVGTDSYQKIPLFDIGEDSEYNDIDKIIETDYKVFSDKPYEVILCPDQSIEKIYNLTISINNEEVQTISGNDFQISFTSPNIFSNCFGLVSIRISFTSNTDSYNLTTPFISILVKQSDENESIKNMVSYISEHQNYLLTSGDINEKLLQTLGESSLKTIQAKLEISSNLLRMYEAQYGYFKANHRYKIKNEQALISFEKIQSIDANAINYIVTHPDNLKKVYTTKGIQIRKSHYQPTKCISETSSYTEDIYENQIIVSFLRKIRYDLNEIIKDETNIINTIPYKMHEDEEYYYSTFFIYNLYIKQHNKYIDELKKIFARFEVMENLYKSSLHVSYIDIPNNGPVPTPIFMTEPVYNQLFIEIHKWYDFGVYDYKEENLFLTFSNVSLLYENYSLLKLIQAIENTGYQLTEISHYEYILDRRRLYKNTRLNNTFIFNNNGTTITLYYQPYIGSGSEKTQNGINLFRNNSVKPFSDKVWTSKYYTPDYIIKVENELGANYHILDAKYSTFRNTQYYHFPELVFKYLFSISCFNKEDHIAGLTLLYGKYEDCNYNGNYYDLQPNNVVISPYAKILALSGKEDKLQIN